MKFRFLAEASEVIHTHQLVQLGCPSPSYTPLGWSIVCSPTDQDLAVTVDQCYLVRQTFFVLMSLREEILQS
jgi:hypothetical protein